MFGKYVGGALVALSFAASSSPSVAASGNCDAHARTVWTASGKGLLAEAISQGANCADAVVTLVLRDPSGRPLWVDSRIGSQVMIFAGVTDRNAMSRALGDWIDQSRSRLARSDKLPDWPKSAAAPQADEFPFYPDSDVDHEAYLKLRAARLPLFCYVQGMESMACVALTSEGITKVGVQTFPG